MRYLTTEIMGLMLMEPVLLTGELGFFISLFYHEELSGRGLDFEPLVISDKDRHWPDYMSVTSS